MRLPRFERVHGWVAGRGAPRGGGGGTPPPPPLQTRERQKKLRREWGCVRVRIFIPLSLPTDASACGYYSVPQIRRCCLHFILRRPLVPPLPPRRQRNPPIPSLSSCNPTSRSLSPGIPRTRFFALTVPLPPTPTPTHTLTLALTLTLTLTLSPPATHTVPHQLTTTTTTHPSTSPLNTHHPQLLNYHPTNNHQPDILAKHVCAAFDVTNSKSESLHIIYSVAKYRH